MLSIVGLRNRRFPLFGRLDPAVQLAAALMSLAFAVGVLVAGPALGTHAEEISMLFLITVVAFICGALLTQRVLPTESPPLRLDLSLDLLRHPALLVVFLSVVAVAAINLATGGIPLLAGSINSVRFGAGAGIFYQLWAWLIGALEWFAIAASVRCVIARRFDWRGLVFASAASGILLLLAGRSFLFLVVFALFLAILTLRRVSLIWLATLGALVLLGLGGSASYRAEHSIGYGGGGKSLSIAGRLTQSAGIGPAVLASVLEETPGYVPFQHGGFVLRDLRVSLPTHPLGRPESSDYWVTTVLRHRRTADVGGSPPTLTGGLYIDFGIPGILVGATLLGTLLTLLYVFVARSRSLAALILYSYFGAYMALSAYSYVSFKPEVMTVVLLSGGAYYLERLKRQSSVIGDLQSERP